jgi:hypothetical protein
MNFLIRIFGSPFEFLTGAFGRPNPARGSLGRQWATGEMQGGWTSVIIGGASLAGGLLSGKGQKDAAQSQADASVEATRLQNESNERLFRMARGSEGNAVLPEYLGGFEAGLGQDLVNIYNASKASNGPTAANAFAAVPGLADLYAQYQQSVGATTPSPNPKPVAPTRDSFTTVPRRPVNTRFGREYVEGEPVFDDAAYQSAMEKYRTAMQQWQAEGGDGTNPDALSQEEWLNQYIAQNPDSAAAMWWDDAQMATLGAGDKAFNQFGDSFQAGNDLIEGVIDGTYGQGRLDRALAVNNADRTGSQAYRVADEVGTDAMLAADRTGTDAILAADRTGSDAVLAADQAGSEALRAADRTGTAGLVNANTAAVKRGIGERLAALKAARTAGGMRGGSSTANNAALAAAIPAYQQIGSMSAEEARRLGVQDANEGWRLDMNRASEGQRLGINEATQAYRLDLLSAEERKRLGLQNASEDARLNINDAQTRADMADQDFQLQLSMLDTPYQRVQQGYAMDQLKDSQAYGDIDQLLERIGLFNIGTGQPYAAQKSETVAVPNSQMIAGSALTAGANAFGNLAASGYFNKGTNNNGNNAFNSVLSDTPNSTNSNYMSPTG